MFVNFNFIQDYVDSLREDAKAFKRKFLEKYPDVNGITLLQKKIPFFKKQNYDWSHSVEFWHIFTVLIMVHNFCLIICSKSGNNNRKSKQYFLSIFFFTFFGTFLSSI